MQKDSFRVRVHFVKHCLLFVTALLASGIFLIAFALSPSYATKMEAGRNSSKELLHLVLAHHALSFLFLKHNHIFMFSSTHLVIMIN